jgi:hypothetical protein
VTSSKTTSLPRINAECARSYLKRNGSACSGDNTQYIFLYRQTRVDVPDRKDGAVRVTYVSMVRISTQCQCFDKHRWLWVGDLPLASRSGDYANLIQCDALLC